MDFITGTTASNLVYRTIQHAVTCSLLQLRQPKVRLILELVSDTKLKKIHWIKIAQRARSAQIRLIMCRCYLHDVQLYVRAHTIVAAERLNDGRVVQVYK